MIQKNSENKEGSVRGATPTGRVLTCTVRRKPRQGQGRVVGVQGWRRDAKEGSWMTRLTGLSV